MKKKQKGVSALVLAAVLSGFFGVFSHYISFTIPLFYQLTIRNLIQLAVVFVIFLFVKEQKRIIARSDLKWFLLRSTCGFLNVAGLYVAFTKISIGTTYFLSFAASTICGYILGSVLFREIVGFRGVAAVVMAITGLGFVYSINFESSTMLYSLAAVGAGVAAPGWSVFSKTISKKYSNIQMNLVDTIFAVGLSLLASLCLRETWVPLQWNAVWIASVVFALISLPPGFLVVYGFKQVEAQTGTLVLLLEIVAGIVLGYVFYRQSISYRDAAGGLLILAAVYLRTSSAAVIHHRLFWHHVRLPGNGAKS